MSLPEDLRHLFLDWLQAKHDIKVTQRCRMSQTYFNAIKSLKQFPNPIKHPNELIELKYFGEKLVAEMNSKLKIYCDDYGYKFPEFINNENTNNSLKRNSNNDLIDKPQKRKKLTTTKITTKTKKTKKKKYVPEMNSGGYAILLTLLIHDTYENGLTKNEITKLATPFCSSSFQTNSATGNFYSAWNSINTLIKNEYISIDGNPKYYSLTESGKEVAKVLKDMHENIYGSIRSFTEPNNNNNNKLNRSFDKQNIGKRSISLPSKNPLNSSSPNVKNNSNNSILSSSPFRGGIINDLKNQRTPLISSSPLKDNILTTLTKSNNYKSEYQIWKKGSYEIKFILDNREVFSKDERDFFSKSLKNMGINIEVRSLPVGDGIWIAVNKRTKQETTLNFIFERKRLDDLASSILDGRYREQKSRLEKTGMKSIIYIIEEQMGSDISNFVEAIKTCISMNTTYSGFHTIKTKDPDQTMILINDLTNLINKLYLNKTLLVLEPRNLNNKNEYNQLLNSMRQEFNDKEVVYSYNTFNEIMGKTSSITIKEIFIKFLMTIKGISLDKAIAIQNHYKTPKNLIISYNKCHNNDPKNCALMIQQELNDEIGLRRIGNALSGKIATIWCKGCCK